MILSPGSRLGPYEVLSLLGTGGMGEVWLARDTRLDRTVAIKVLGSGLDEDSSMRQRFEREARAISSLNHPNVCTLHDVGRQEGFDYLVMEHVEGETLAATLAKGPLSMDLCFRTAIEITGALDRAHKAGVVHRDLKPGNVMLTRSGAKLLDFGLARFEGPLAGAGGLAEVREPPLTQEGTILGTLQYMAPEQLQGRSADARSDLFSFGAMLHEMITGKRAFPEKEQASLIAAILERDPPPALARASIPRRSIGSSADASRRIPSDRGWQSARDLMHELRGSQTAAARRLNGAPAFEASRARGLVDRRDRGPRPPRTGLPPAPIRPGGTRAAIPALDDSPPARALRLLRPRRPLAGREARRVRRLPERGEQDLRAALGQGPSVGFGATARGYRRRHRAVLVAGPRRQIGYFNDGKPDASTPTGARLSS
jgi:serine/threonine protein kinase